MKTWKIDGDILTNSNQVFIFEDLLNTHLEYLLNTILNAFHHKCHGYKNTIIK